VEAEEEEEDEAVEAFNTKIDEAFKASRSLDGNKFRAGFGVVVIDSNQSMTKTRKPEDEPEEDEEEDEAEKDEDEKDEPVVIPDKAAPEAAEDAAEPVPSEEPTEEAGTII
jgi:hypothetical protein